ncbi:hypothetical protein BOMU111920_06445 [Bordetella muralis]
MAGTFRATDPRGRWPRSGSGAPGTRDVAHQRLRNSTILTILMVAAASLSMISRGVPLGACRLLTEANATVREPMQHWPSEQAMTSGAS